jgi:transcriptional regulator with XRE-family HTH domain
MTKPSDKKPSGSTQGRSRASAKKVDTTPASATETKKPQSKTRTPAKKPAAASSAKYSDTKAAPAVAKAPRVRSSAAAKKPESAPAPAPETAPVAAGAAKTGKSPAKRISALAKKALADAQPESQAAAEAGPLTDAETSPRDRNRIEGARLIKMIRKVIIERGLQDRTIADIVGVTQIYWNSLANGNRQIKSLGKEKLQKIAEFLGLPLIQVYLLAEHFTAEDFFNSKDLNEQLWLSVRKMQEDPQWAGYAPSSEEWEQTPINVRITLVSLYERESKRYLMAKAEVEVPGNNFTE